MHTEGTNPKDVKDPKEEMKGQSVKLSVDTLSHLEELASARGKCSIQSLVRLAVKEFLDRNPRVKPLVAEIKNEGGE